MKWNCRFIAILIASISLAIAGIDEGIQKLKSINANKSYDTLMYEFADIMSGRSSVELANPKLFGSNERTKAYDLMIDLSRDLGVAIVQEHKSDYESVLQALLDNMNVLPAGTQPELFWGHIKVFQEYVSKSAHKYAESSIIETKSTGFPAFTYSFERKQPSTARATITVKPRSAVGPQAGASYDDPGVVVVAPAWLQTPLRKLSEHLQGSVVNFDYPGHIKHTNTIYGGLSLPQLQFLSRNEGANVSGIIKYDQYQGIAPEAVLSLKDLVRHTVIIGRANHRYTGGYPSGRAAQHKARPIYVIDLSGIQFQTQYNTGRLFIIAPNDDLPKGVLDNEIYENVVGEAKPEYTDLLKKGSGSTHHRYYKPAIFQGKDVLFDTKAYVEFIKKDFLLAILAMDKAADATAERINFKFVKYGAGFFADGLDESTKGRLNFLIPVGVKKAIEVIIKNKIKLNNIARIELPFYQSRHRETTMLVNEIKELVTNEKTGLGLSFSAAGVDAMESYTDPKTGQVLVTATTNAADPHVPTGNEMHHDSLDAAIGQNLDGKAHKFNPVLNTKMRQLYITLPR